jgi:hypothetical protein
MFYIKSTKDPLQLISQLDALNMLSRTHVKKEEFKAKLQKQDDFIELEDDQKEFLLAMWDSRESSRASSLVY